MKFLYIIILLALSATYGCSSMQQDAALPLDALSPQLSDFPQISPTDTITTGRQMASVGHHHILIVFVAPHEDSDWWAWPVNHSTNQSPNPQNPFDSTRLLPFMEDIANSTREENSGSNENLTRFFKEVSNGKLLVTGDIAYVQAPPPDVLPANARYGDYNQWIIRNRLESHVEWSRYDNWTTLGHHQHLNQPDKEIDNVVFVWHYEKAFLNVSWHGIANFGGRGPIVELSDGFVMRNGGLNHSRSGLTVLHRGNWERAFSYLIHEFAHLFVGLNHTYSGRANQADYGYWGLFYSMFSNLSINPYEADFLGWADVIDIKADTSLVLNDFLKTGQTARFEVERNKYFYLTNRQRISDYDNPSINENDKGVFASFYRLPYLTGSNNARPLVADGNFDWNLVGESYACNPRMAVPIFEQGSQNPQGFSFRDPIPTAPDTTRNIFILSDDPERCTSYFKGVNRFTGFSSEKGRNNIVSPFSNPPSDLRNGNSTRITVVVADFNDDGSANVDFSLMNYKNIIDTEVLKPAQEILNKHDHLFLTHHSIFLNERFEFAGKYLVIDTNNIYTSSGYLELEIDTETKLIVNGETLPSGVHQFEVNRAVLAD